MTYAVVLPDELFWAAYRALPVVLVAVQGAGATVLSMNELTPTAVGDPHRC